MSPEVEPEIADLGVTSHPSYSYEQLIAICYHCANTVIAIMGHHLPPCSI